MKNKKIVCIGNSIVNGFPLKRSLCFTSLLRTQYGYETINKGENGDTTAGIFSRFDHDVISHSPDICIMLTGTNDFMLGTPVSEAVSNIEEMIKKAEGIKMVILTPLLADVKMAQTMWMPADYERVNRELIDFAEKIKKLDGCFFIDTQKAFLEFAEENGAEKVYRDGIHPLAAGHEFLAEYIAQQLKEMEL